jgi:hypothetical protein
VKISLHFFRAIFACSNKRKRILISVDAISFATKQSWEDRTTVIRGDLTIGVLPVIEQQRNSRIARCLVCLQHCGQPTAIPERAEPA